jgi:hypothetical protein
MPVLATDWNFGNFLLAMLSFFFFVIWIWLLFTVFADVFRRHDIGGWGKTGWVLLVIILPYFGVFIYLIAEHTGMAAHRHGRARAEGPAAGRAAAPPDGWLQRR